MAWMPNGAGHCARARLCIEALEERALLTIAGFEMNLFADDGGVPGELISTDTVEVGESFFVEITAADRRQDATGLAGYPPGIRGLALDIAWNPQAFEEIDDPFDPASGIVTDSFPLFRDGKLDNSAGRIDDLQGAMSLSMSVGELIGEDEPERFALLHFRALVDVGASVLSMNLGLRQISMFPSVLFIKRSDFEFESQSITVVEQTESAPVASPPDDPPVHTNIDDQTESPVADPTSTNTTAPPDVKVNVYQGAGGAPAALIDSDAVDPDESFYVESIVEPPRGAPQPTGGSSIAVDDSTDVAGEIDEPSEATNPATRIAISSLPPFAGRAFDFAVGQLSVSRIRVNVEDVAVGLPPAASGVEDVVRAPHDAPRIGLTYGPRVLEAAAADAVFGTASTEELAPVASVHVDHALLQALASGLAAAANEDKVSDPFSPHPI